MVEYLVTSGETANIPKGDSTENDWEFDGNGILQNGDTIPLKDSFKLSLTTDIIFGTYGEDLALTQLIAPHTSRSYVLASETNYKYFFQRMNMFSDIEI